MPVYAPFPTTHFENGTCDMVPRDQSTFLGYWYSFPSQAECAPVSPGSGSRGRHGSGPASAGADCTWARHTAQRLVRGQALLGLGFNLSAACDVPQLVQNRDVIEYALATHPSRCCGC